MQKKQQAEESSWELLSDIIYHPDYSHQKVSLDVYKPKDKSGDGASATKRPVLIFVHGGGWQRGDKRRVYLVNNINVGFAQTMASRGLVCVSVNYRLSRVRHLYRNLVIPPILGLIATFIFSILFFLLPLVVYGTTPLSPWWMGGFFIIASAALLTFIWWANTRVESDHQKERVIHPAHILDVAHAYKYVTDHAEEWGGDPNCIFLAGHSAGGHLVSLLSLNPSYLEQAGYSKDLINSVKGVIPISAVLHLGRLNKHIIPRYFYLVPSFGFKREVYFEASPMTYAKGRNLHFPFLLFNASSDMHLPRDSKEMAELLKESGNEATCHTIPGTSHRSIVSNVGTPKDGLTNLIVEFIEKNSKTKVK